MRLERPSHIVAFGIALALLFTGTFAATEALTEEPPQPQSHDAPEGEPLSWAAPPASEPAPLPDLAILQVTARECLAAPGAGTSVVKVEIANHGQGRTGGFRMYAEAEVENVLTGAKAAFRLEHWEENVDPAGTRAYEIPIAYPVAEYGPVEAVTSQTPVPGEYRITVTIDQPTVEGLERYRESGLVEEEDKDNNVAEIHVNGVATGTC